MSKWRIYYTNQAVKDAKKLKNSNLKKKAQTLLKLITLNPFEASPPYEKLTGDFTGCYSRRINIQHRLVYTIYKKEKAIKILRMWSHYE